MTRNEYTEIENYILDHMNDSALDKHHVYSVLNAVSDIGKHETSVDLDMLISACLLQNIGRERQFAKKLCHA